MKKLEYQVSFNTPAFLGNAEQLAQWRTPPFKALIRHWWRIVKAPELDYDHAKLRMIEGRLFGNAWLVDDFRKSDLRLRIYPWEIGSLQSSSWPGGPMDTVVTTRDGKGKVRSDLYLGYGPVLPPSKKEGRSQIEIRRAIGIAEKANLKLMMPSALIDDLEAVVDVIGRFGTLGSRSRNGWGSVFLERIGRTADSPSSPGSRDSTRRCLRRLESCLLLDWAHAIGSDGNGALIWQTSPCENWRKAMGRLANVRVSVRRAAKQFTGPKAVGGVHLLGYPAGGRWELQEWRGRSRDEPEGRLASQLRFKVFKDEQNRYYGTVFHTPYRVPSDLANRLDMKDKIWLETNQLRIWKTIHETLDSGLDRVKIG
jgi:CRISPR-associated protein Cmr1